MATLQKQILKASKEIVVKFIETGRVSPTSFDETFRSIHRTVTETVYRTADIEEDCFVNSDKKT